MQLCDAFDIPILFLCDTPGIMVGPEIEKTALVRHSSRLFLTGANLSVPFFTIVLRKAYGLGAIAMAGGSFKVPYFSVSWPTGEFGGMGLEGSVKLGYRDELAAIEDPDETAGALSSRWWRAPTNGARRSTTPPLSASTTRSTRPSRGAGWPTCWLAPAAGASRRKEAGGDRRLVVTTQNRRPVRRLKVRFVCDELGERGFRLTGELLEGVRAGNGEVGEGLSVEARRPPA